MKHFSLLLGVVAVLALVAAGSVFAAEGGGKAPGGKGGKGGGGTFGEIIKKDGMTLTIKSTREGAPDVTGTVTDATEISQEVPAKLGDLRVGDRVRITQGEKRFYGEITSKEGNVLTLKGRSGQDEKVTVGESDKISAYAKAKLEDLKVGQQVMASVTEGKFTRISVRAPDEKR
jgi:hypothetical protein